MVDPPCTFRSFRLTIPPDTSVYKEGMPAYTRGSWGCEKCFLHEFTFYFSDRRKPSMPWGEEVVSFPLRILHPSTLPPAKAYSVQLTADHRHSSIPLAAQTAELTATFICDLKIHNQGRASHDYPSLLPSGLASRFSSMAIPSDTSIYLNTCLS